MKRILSVLLVVLTIAGCSFAFAEDTGIQIISSPDAAAEVVNLDDWKEGQTAKIQGFGDITLTSVFFTDSIPTEVYIDSYQYSDGKAKSSLKSGSTAEYLKIRLHILNTQKKPFDFLKVFGENIICDFGDGYQFGGWARQERKVDDRFWTMYSTKDSSYQIQTLYEGYFDVVVTLPNYVVESKEPLSVTFSIGENEFTVHFRK